MDNSNNQKNIILDILAQNGLTFKFQVQRLKRKWNEIVGENLSMHTEPYKIYKSVLIVRCSHQGFIQALQFQKEVIKAKLNKIFENEFEINDIEFRYYTKRE